MDSIYQQLWLENSTKVGVATYHVENLLQLLVNHVNAEELSSFDRADVEIAIEHAQKYLDKDREDRKNSQKHVEELISKWEEKEYA
jgi:hypothetical protein